MLEQICGFIHNYFMTDDHGQYWHCEEGTFTISNGSITLPFLVNGQFFRIVGSRLNDGVYQYPVTVPQNAAPILIDETFTGKIYEMRPPRAFLKLVDDIGAWMKKYGDIMNSPYQSENVIGVYSYTKAGSGSNGSGGSDAKSDWQSVFFNRLNEWRKIA